MANRQGLVAPGNQREQSSVISGRWKQVEALFEQALEVPAVERPQFLEGIGDDELRREVVSLLQAHDQAGAFLDEPDHFISTESLEENGGSFLPGEIIDRYRIIREIGRGGMGAVFLAERADDQYQKQVAIKLIKRGMDTESVLRHFRNERQILAGFDHPNIARLFDGGTTESGLPYFVMEYIEGLPIDEYSNVHALSVVERLKLFREVCAAVSYAHRHLVIHRDIKRSNILVTAEGVPKLLDFGIAKILQQGDQPMATMTGMRVMTPEYASPEQLQGRPVTTASDVYSLGVLLYELLTGQSPYGSAAPQSNDFAQVINEIHPKKPSTVLARADNPQSAIRNPRFLKGDLDNIVLMALRKEPERRYQSVEQFSEDIRRHLEARPVHARKDTFGYRSAKFVRRNKVALAAAALVLVMLISGIIATSWQAQKARLQEQRARAEQARAERRFNDVRKLAHSVLFDYHDAIQSLPGATKVRERLVKDALTYLGSLAAEAQGDSVLQRELATAYERVGDVRGGTSSGNLGDIAGAIDSYTKSLNICESLAAANTQDTQARRDLARNHQKIGDRLLATKEASRGMEHLQKARALYVDLMREEPQNEDLQFEFAGNCNDLADAVIENGRDLAGGLELYRAALAICEKLSTSHPRERKFRHRLWISNGGVAHALWLNLDTAGALEANSKALKLGEALMAEDPLNTEYRRVLVLTYQYGGNYRKRSDKPAALEYFRRAAELDEASLASDPADAATRNDLGYTHKRIADFLAQFGELRDNSQALVHFSKAVEAYEKLAEDAPADLMSKLKAATCRAGVAGMQARLGATDLALRDCGKTITLLQETPDDATNTRPRFERGEAYEYLGYAYVALAASRKLSASESRQYTSRAREMFQQTRAIIDDLRNRNAFDANNSAGWATEISEEIAKCDAALKK